MQNKLITIEGIEGVGKTTALKVIQDYLTQQQREFILTREPGGTEMAEQIRKILLTPHAEKITAEAELLLMFACRAQHIANVILPALEVGKWVVSDRYVDASYAYQGGGRQIDMARIQMLDQWITGMTQPHLTFLLDAPPETGLARARNRSAHDRIEQEKIAFFERVREVYLKRAEKYPERFCVIDATQPLENVHHELTMKLDKLFASTRYAH